MLQKLWRAAALCLAVLPAAQALAWPDKPITIVVPFPAGGSIDAAMRVIAQPLGQQLGQTVVVENVGGASGAIGAARVAHAQPDGTTLLAGSINDVVLQPLFNTSVRYGTNDLTPLSLAFTSPLVLVARKDLPQADIDGVVQALKKAPGSLSFGSPGQGTFQHVVMEELQRRTHTSMLHVPYKGAAPLVNDVLGGQIDMAVMAPPTALPHLQQGRLKMLGVISKNRLSAYPDMPTINESQSVTGMDMVGWVGLLSPRGVPEDRQARLRAAFSEVMQRPDVRERVVGMGMEPPQSTDGASFAKRIADDVQAMRPLVRQIQQ